MTALVSPWSAAVGSGGAAVAGVVAVWRGEMVKLAALVRTRLILGLCAVVPFGALTVLRASEHHPE